MKIVADASATNEVTAAPSLQKLTAGRSQNRDHAGRRRWHVRRVDTVVLHPRARGGGDAVVVLPRLLIAHAAALAQVLDAAAHRGQVGDGRGARLDRGGRQGRGRRHRLRQWHDVRDVRPRVDAMGGVRVVGDVV